MIHFVIKIYKRLFYSLAKRAVSAGVKMGNNNFIASKFWSTEPYLISIGDNCQITAGVKLLTHGGGHVIRNKYPQFDTFGKVSIGNNVYLGNNVLVMPGCTIGNNVLCAAGSVITKSIPDNCVVGGNPAKYICSIDEYEKRNLRYNINSKGLSIEEKKKLLLQLDDSFFCKKNYIEVVV